SSHPAQIGRDDEGEGMRVLKQLLLGLACLVMLPPVSFAPASVTGVVKDSSGAVLPGVNVEVSSDALIERVRTAVTDSSGTYRIVHLRARPLPGPSPLPRLSP